MRLMRIATLDLIGSSAATTSPEIRPTPTTLTGLLGVALLARRSCPWASS